MRASTRERDNNFTFDDKPDEVVPSSKLLATNLRSNTTTDLRNRQSRPSKDAALESWGSDLAPEELDPTPIRAVWVSAGPEQRPLLQHYGHFFGEKFQTPWSGFGEPIPHFVQAFSFSRSMSS